MCFLIRWLIAFSQSLSKMSDPITSITAVQGCSRKASLWNLCCYLEKTPHTFNTLECPLWGSLALSAISQAIVSEQSRRSLVRTQDQHLQVSIQPLPHTSQRSRSQPDIIICSSACGFPDRHREMFTYSQRTHWIRGQHA